MKNITLVLLVLAVSFFGCKEEHDSEIKVVSSEEMQTILELDDVQLVDVRTPKEYEDGFIKGAQNIDFKSPTFEDDILKLDKNKPVIVYCHSGGRSAKCSKKLKDAGFIKIYDLKGGFSKWKHEGLDFKVLDIKTIE